MELSQIPIWKLEKARLEWCISSKMIVGRAVRSSPARWWSKRLPAIPVSHWRWFAQQKVIRSWRFMVETFSIERRKLMRALGAKVILTPAAERGAAWSNAPRNSRRSTAASSPRQFDNPANPAYHRNTTGPEILQDFAGRRFDWFVSGWGTGGTLTGAGEMLRLARPEVAIVMTEPAVAAMLAGKRMERRTRSRAGPRISFRRFSIAMCSRTNIPIDR